MLDPLGASVILTRPFQTSKAWGCWYTHQTLLCPVLDDSMDGSKPI